MSSPLTVGRGSELQLQFHFLNNRLAILECDETCLKWLSNAPTEACPERSRMGRIAAKERISTFFTFR
jgi:hypothetical protein